jgi:2-keto-4-pentenoate hydratase
MGALDDPRIARGMATQFALRRERLDAGEWSIGWKAGFGAPAAMEMLSISAPLVGFLTDKVKVEAGATVSIGGWAQAVIEPEIAIHVSGDPGRGADDETVGGVIAGLGVAFELADLDPPPKDVEAVLAGNIYNRHVMLGPCNPARAGGGTAGLAGLIHRNGEVFASTGDLEANTGRLIAITREISDVVAGLGESLKAGDVIIAGSIVPPVFVDPDRDAEEVSFEVGELGRLSVRVER